MAVTAGGNIDALLRAHPEYGEGAGEWEVIVKYNGDLGRVEKSLGVSAEILGDSFAILTLPAESVPRLYDYGEIEYIELPKNLTLMLSGSLPAACITQAQNPGGYGLTGKGTVIGIIDSGVDYAHPDFRDAAGNSRILYLWDQTGEGNPPEGFGGGAEYTAADFNVALKSSRPYDVIPPTDDIGHGTAVAGIAAGNGRASGGAQTGAAPEASIIAVRLGRRGGKSFARTTEIMRALNYISGKALELGMPVAINLSFGTNNGSHSGSSLFETYIDAVSRRWKSVIVVAAGNEGAAGHHFMGKVSAGETVNAEFAVTVDLYTLYLTLWKNFADTFSIELVSPGGQSSGPLNPAISFASFRLDAADVAVYYGQPSIYDGGHEVFIQISNYSRPIPQGLGSLRVTGRKITDGEFHIWLPTTEEVGTGTAFTVPDPSLTVTLPATAEGVISVGGYDALTGSAASFSGRGYTYRSVYVKPDLAAPAMSVMTARAGGGYDTFTGTSMAAPFVTGAAALMLEWGVVRGNDPFLYGQRVKAYLQRTAREKPGQRYPNPIWGYGTLCLKAAMDNLAEYRRY